MKTPGKKTWIVLVVLIAGLVLSGCGKQVTAEHPVTRVSVILPHSDDGYWVNIKNGIEEKQEEAAKYGIDIKVFIPQLNYNASEMTDILKQQIAARTDFVVVQGNEDEGFVQALQEAHDQGMKVVFMDTDLSDFPEHLYVGTDNYKAGYLIGEQMAEKTNGKADIAVISGSPGYPNLEERLEGLKDAMKNYPGLSLKEVLYDNYDGLTFMKRYESVQDADTLVCLEGTGAQTLSRMFSGHDSRYRHIFGFDITDGIPTDVVDGILVQDTKEIGNQVVTQLEHYVQTGKYSNNKIYTDVHYVTKDNYKAGTEE